MSSLRRSIRLSYAVLLSFTVCIGGAHGSEQTAAAKDLCITNGQVKANNEVLEVDTSSSRFIVKSMDDDYAAIRFEYRGPTAETSLFASGTMRRQIGVKLRNPNSCNGVYVMWRIEPESDIQVQLKLNSGKSTMKECGVKGYREIKPSFAKSITPIKVDQPRTLSAAFDKEMLVVRVDGEVVWRGDPGPASRALSGYAGFRSDNARVRLTYIGHARDSNRSPSPLSKVNCH